MLPHSLSYMQLCYTQLQEQAEEAGSASTTQGKNPFTPVPHLMPPVHLGREKVCRKGEIQRPFQHFHTACFHSPSHPAHAQLLHFLLATQRPTIFSGLLQSQSSGVQR